MKTSTILSVLSASFLAATGITAQTFTYDFNSQWNNDWQTYYNQSGGVSPNTTLNYSKTAEGRSGGASGNYFGGNVQSLGYQGSLTSVFSGTSAQKTLAAVNDRIRLQGSFSAFSSQTGFTGGSSEVGQVGLLGSPALSNNTAGSTLKNGNSVYLGFIERSWTGQNGVAPFPGSAEVEIGIFVGGTLTESFGTFTVSDYGARAGSQVWSQWFEYDLVFEHLGDGSLGYKAGINTVSFYDADLNSAPDPTEGTPVSLGVFEGAIASLGGITVADADKLFVSYGTYIAPDGLASVTGYTFDHLPGGDIHDGIITIVPEPSAALLLGFAGSLMVLRRRR